MDQWKSSEDDEAKDIFSPFLGIMIRVRKENTATFRRRVTVIFRCQFSFQMVVVFVIVFYFPLHTHTVIIVDLWPESFLSIFGQFFFSFYNLELL